MRACQKLAIAATTLVALAGAAAPAPAAESFDSCVGFIDTIPVALTVQGTWCLRQDLATSASSGHMIEIQTNNVTIDCNGFKIGGQAGGTSTTAVAIHASGHNNLTIRNCTIRAFQTGIDLEFGSGYLIEDNLLDQNRHFVIIASGIGGVVRRNTVTNSGGAPGIADATAIFASGDIIDNVVDGISGASSQANFIATGIVSDSGDVFNGFVGVLIQGNRVRNLAPKGTGGAFGIVLDGQGASVRDNVIAQPSATSGTAVLCTDSTSHVRDNVILNYQTAIKSTCDNAGGNSVN